MKTCIIAALTADGFIGRDAVWNQLPNPAPVADHQALEAPLVAEDIVHEPVARMRRYSAKVVE